MAIGVTRKWVLASVDAAQRDQLAQGLACSPLLATLLLNRKIVTEQHAGIFLEGNTTHLGDPFLLEGMDIAVGRIMRAITSGERILIQGHDDLDGITSVIVLEKTLRALAARVTSSIPQRSAGVYGLSGDILRRAKANGVGLIITVDSGIMNFEEVLLARKLGIDCIITDHHEPPAQIPLATAVINPKRADSRYPWRYLAGVGVAYKLAQGVAMRRQGLSSCQWFACVSLPTPAAGGAGGRQGCQDGLWELVALGTVADRVPLLDENRIMTKLGLSALPRTTRPGLRALLDLSGLGTRASISSEDVMNSLVSPLSGSVYEGEESLGQRLFLAGNQEEAERIAELLYRGSADWRQGSQEAYDEVLGLLDLTAIPGSKILVLFLTTIDPAFLGNVASRLREETGRPVVLIGVRGERGVAEARGPAGFDLVDCFRDSAHLLLGYGGHKQAAGFSISVENIGAFTNRAVAYAGSRLSLEDLGPVVFIEAGLGLDALNAAVVRDVERLQPFGPDNPEPLFISKEVALKERKGGGHEILGHPLVALCLEGDGGKESGNMRLSPDQLWDLVYHVRPERRERIALLLEDWRPSGSYLP